MEIGDLYRILEICDPKNAKEVLTADMDLNFALPCRVSIYSDHGKTKIDIIRPTAMQKAPSDSPALARVAEEVEEAIIIVIDEAK